jgi:hypothetical protein
MSLDPHTGLMHTKARQNRSCHLVLARVETAAGAKELFVRVESSTSSRRIVTSRMKHVIGI